MHGMLTVISLALEFQSMNVLKTCYHWLIIQNRKTAISLFFLFLLIRENAKEMPRWPSEWHCVKHFYSL